MTKRIISGVLLTALCLSLLTSCGESKPTETTSQPAEQNSQTEQKTDNKETDGNDYTIYVRDKGKSAKMTATFWNSSNDDSKKEVEMEKVGESGGDFIYSCTGDTSLYNMMHFDYGAPEPSMDVAFNKFVSGWYLNNGKLLPYVEGKEPKYQPKYETKVFRFDGYDKNVYIWTPDDYDKDSADKYSVIYMLDGQTVLSTEISGEIESWNVAEHVESMMAATDNKAMIVAIETMGASDENDELIASRDDELLPDIAKFKELDGQTLQSKKRGDAFSDFIYDTVAPYIEENYNVYTDAAHNSVCGSSFGGLASFYIGIDHPDKFGTVGVLSASFQIYDEASLAAYAKKITLNDNMPFLYFYAGSYNADTAESDVDMYNFLIENGYPKNKLVFNKDEDGGHFVPFWRNIYPEFLEAMFTQKVSALESGAPIEYTQKDFSNIEPVSIDPNDSRPAEIFNYFYFDNSETKWDKVYAYWWGTKPINVLTGEEWYGMKGPWPGLEMERIGDSDIYRIVLPLGKDLGLVFNSGVTDDEVKNGVVAYQTADLKYSSSINAGQIFKIDVSDEPKPGTGIQKTKFKYKSGAWSNYEG